MFCNQCGKELPEGSKFCNSCGANLMEDITSEAVSSVVEETQQAEPVQQATPVQQAEPVQQATPVQQAASIQQTAPVQQPYVQPQMQQGYAQPQMQQGYAQPQMQQGYAQPQMQQGYVQPQAQQGYAQPQMQQGYAQPQMQQGYAQPQMQQGYVQPQMQQGYAQPKKKMKWLWAPITAGVLAIAVAVVFIFHPFGLFAPKDTAKDQYLALCDMTSLGSQSYMNARLMTEQLIETDLATADQNSVEKLFSDCLEAWEVTAQVTAQIDQLSAKLAEITGLGGNNRSVGLIPIRTAYASSTNSDGRALSGVLDRARSVERCSQLGSQLGSDANTAAANVRRMQQVYNGRSTSVNDWNAAADNAANSFNTNVYLAGELSFNVNTSPTSNARSLRTLSNNVKGGGLVLDNTNMVIDVGDNSSTIVMGQGSGITMSTDELSGGLPGGDTSMISICTYPEDPNELGITFHDSGLSSWLITGRVGGFRITRGDKDEDEPDIMPEIVGGSFDTDPDISDEEFDDSFRTTCVFDLPQPVRGTIDEWVPPICTDDVRDDLDDIIHIESVNGNNDNDSNNNNNNNNQEPQSGPVDEATLNDRLVHEGASQGEITVSMLWGTYDDLDLHMNTPDNSHIYYSNKSAGGGTLDVDMNAGGSRSLSPVENIYFPNPSDGHYKVYIRNYRDRTDSGPSHYMVRVIVNGEEHLFEGDIDGTGTEIVIYEFDYVGPDEPTLVNPLNEENMNQWLIDAGAGTGEITVSLAWDSSDDVDLHMKTPKDHEIYYSNKSADGGVLDVDANVSTIVPNPVENIFFAVPENGHYKVWIKEYNDRNRDSTTNYMVRVTVGDQSQTFTGTLDTTGTTVDIIEFDYGGASQGAQDTFEGHRYAYYDDNGSMTWTQARAYCQEQGGHLVTINSAAEQDFLNSAYPGARGYIGAYGDDQSGAWSWVTGEPMDYTNWSSGEPNNSGNEWFGHLYSDGTWNDISNDDQRSDHKGFFCEWDSMTDLNEENLINVLQDHGALSGEITVSVMWDSADDIDLHVFTPDGLEIYYDNPNAGGGNLDIDANRTEDSVVSDPIENIYFSNPDPGEYWVYVYDYMDRSDSPTNYIVRVTIGDRSETFTGTLEGSGSSDEVTGFVYGQ